MITCYLKNEAHFVQANFTTFGNAGPGFPYINPESPMTDSNIEDMLNGLFEPWEGASEHTIQWIKALKRTVTEPIDTSTTIDDYMNYYKRMKENTASSPSGLHYGHYKSLAKQEHSL
jgi:hypothetical protein